MHEIWPFPAPQAKIYGVCGRWCWYQNHAPFPAYSVNFRLRRHKWGEVGRFGPPLARAKKRSLLFLLRCLSTLLPWKWSTPPAATHPACHVYAHSTTHCWYRPHPLSRHHTHPLWGPTPPAATHPACHVYAHSTTHCWYRSAPAYTALDTCRLPLDQPLRIQH